MNDPDIGSGSIGYLLFPFDLIPDFIPLIGHLYDMIIVPALVFCGSENDTQEVIEECRMPAEKEGD